MQPEEFVKRFPDHERIVAIYGEACIRIGNALTLNENYFVRRFVAEHRLLYDQKEAAFYFYEASDGAWHKSHYDVCRKKVREDFGAMAVSKFVRSKGTAGTFDAITNGVRVVCGTKERFKRLPRGMIHCANGMFQLHSDGTVKNFWILARVLFT